MEVARLAGVSQSAVSRAFTPGASVSDATQQKVRAAAKALGYQPNAIARSLITQRTNIVGLVMGDFANPFYTEVLAALSVELQLRERQVLLFAVPPGRGVDELLPFVLQYQVDAIVIAATTLSSAMGWECHRRGTPVILFNRMVPDTPTHVVTTDNFAGGMQVAQMLAEAGHKRFGYIAGHADTSTSIDRERGFFSGLRSHGITTIQRHDGRYSYRGAFEAGIAMLSARRRPEAVFCANDMMAMGFLDAARQLGIAVPDELSVVGFDDIPQAAWDAYSLTTMRQPIDQMVASTVELVTKPADGARNDRATFTFLPQLVARRSARLL
jgi:DNA-binding LacI/PurR family transcriptional regulator